MNKRAFQRIITTALAGLLIWPSGAAEKPQPHMTKVLNILKKARDSARPLPLLERAKEHLESSTEKKGRREDSIKAVDAAIEAVKKGVDPKSKITHAIALVNSGLERGD